MIALRRPYRVTNGAAEPAWHAGFLALLPDIERQVQFAFRKLPLERREEAVQSALANALVAYLRLYELGKTALAYATPLALYAVRQVCAGRQVGGRLNIGDVLSLHAQRQQRFRVERLQVREQADDDWREVLVEDRRCTPAQLAACRLDVAAWLKRLPPAKRRAAKLLATGETTGTAAAKLRLTPGRVSQLRRELAASWRRFQGDAASVACN